MRPKIDGKRLQRIREERYMTLVALEEESGINAVNISKMENGHILRPRFATLKKLAQALDVHPDELVVKEGLLGNLRAFDPSLVA